MGVEEVEDDGVDKDGQDTGLTAHKEATGAGGDSKKETWAEKDEEDYGKKHLLFYIGW